MCFAGPDIGWAAHRDFAWDKAVHRVAEDMAVGDMAAVEAAVDIAYIEPRGQMAVHRVADKDMRLVPVAHRADTVAQ